jgi:hypothetical protein
MEYPRVIVVLLRQPKRGDPQERRDDPFWEFGSFGCTGCHRKNLMNPKRTNELVGTQFAFVQGGSLGYRLVYLTPPLSFKPLAAGVTEALWTPGEMPLAYSAAPIVVANDGSTHIALLAAMADGVRRPTPVSRFASAFRSRRSPVAGVVGLDIATIYQSLRKRGAVAENYIEALPYAPSVPESNRRQRYDWLCRRAKSRQWP